MCKSAEGSQLGTDHVFFSSQSSSFNPTIRLNSPILWVTRVVLWALEIAAINISFGPIIFPWEVKSARIWAYSSAQRSSNGRLASGAKNCFNHCLCCNSSWNQDIVYIRHGYDQPAQ